MSQPRWSVIYYTLKKSSRFLYDDTIPQACTLHQQLPFIIFQKKGQYNNDHLQPQTTELGEYMALIKSQHWTSNSLIQLLVGL